jgi:hypothetical protein
METKNLSIHFSAMAPTISKQLTQQEFKFDDSEVKTFEKLKDSIIWLSLHDIMNDGQVKKAYDKLFTKIKRHVSQQNKIKIISK